MWALVLLMLVSSLASVATAQASSPTTYTVSGFVDQPNQIAPMKAGVTVDLISGATHQVLATTTSAGGSFTFTTSSTNGALGPGWWGLWVPPQTHLKLGGSTEWAVLPVANGAKYTYLSAANLTSPSYPGLYTTAQLLQLSQTIQGTVYQSGGGIAVGANLQLLSPTLTGFAVNATTSNITGQYVLHAPVGTWILQTTYNGTQTLYNTTQVTVGTTTLTVNPVIQQYLAQGFILNSATGGRIDAPGNVTLYDPATHALLSNPTVPGFYTIGTYPSGFTGPGAESFVVLVNPSDYSTVAYTAQVSPSTPSVYRNVNVQPQSPAAQYQTTLLFGPGFGKLNVTTRAHLGNDSVLPELANASVGQLWAQLGLDFNGGLLTFNGTDPTQVANLQGWLSGLGPFFPAGESGLLVNGSSYGQPNNDSFTAPVIPAAQLSLTSPQGLWMNWTQNYNTTSTPTNYGTGRLYTIAFNFRHPSGSQAINYTVDLPSGYTLAANTAKPSYASIVPAGPGGTYTNFTLESRAVPSGVSNWGSANFTVVRYSAITAIVNITVANFAYSSLNVLNSTRANYTAVVGVGQNVTFSALNSTYPDGTNGTLYAWNFGGATRTTTTATTYYTYTTQGVYSGSVNVTSSGGKQSQTGFKLYVGNESPVASITSNATAAMTHSSGGVTYLMVNWSTPLQFNVSSSSSPLAPNITQKGVLADASWSITSNSFNQTGNYSAGTGANVDSNLTFTFLGNGKYFSNATIGGSQVSFLGWWYNVTLNLWDGQGHKATAMLPVLVRDTEKPVPVLTLQNLAGKNVSASGLVEAANHTAGVIFSSQYSYDPHNGSVVRYNWTITNTGNSSFYRTLVTTKTKWTAYLPPQSAAYKVNLTAWDRASNTAYVTQSLTISVNASTRPILSVTNLTAPGTLTDGTSYTIWGNITDTVGQNSTADNVTVNFYLLSPSGSGSRTYIVPSSAVRFYNFTTSGVMSSTVNATGVLRTLAYNHTVRAEISWSPGVSGSFTLYMNATASNAFSNTGPNVASAAVTINPSSTMTTIEEIVIVVVVVVIAVVIFLWYRRGSRPKSSSSKGTPSGKSGLERGGKKPATDDDDET
jgi:hypothetical protein